MQRCALLSVVVVIMLGAGCASSRTTEQSVPQASPPSAIVIAAILPAGVYRCVVTDGPAAMPDSEVTIERQGDRVVAIPKSGRRLEGYLYGTRLALVSASVREIGIEVLQVQASQQPDGTFAGTIERLRDGVLMERRTVVLTR